MITPADPLRERVLNLLESMARNTTGMDRNQPGYEHANGWNAAIRQAMDYVNGGALATKPAESCHWPECPHGSECVHATKPAETNVKIQQGYVVTGGHFHATESAGKSEKLIALARAVEATGLGEVKVSCLTEDEQAEPREQPAPTSRYPEHLRGAGCKAGLVWATTQAGKARSPAQPDVLPGQCPMCGQSGFAGAQPPDGSRVQAGPPSFIVSSAPAMVDAPAPSQPIAALTDEQIDALYQDTFNAQSDRKRNATPAGRLVFEFARAIERAALTHRSGAPTGARGYLHNCEVVLRSSDDAPLFEQDSFGNVYCYLDGYRIEPIETQRSSHTAGSDVQNAIQDPSSPPVGEPEK